MSNKETGLIKIQIHKSYHPKGCRDKIKRLLGEQRYDQYFFQTKLVNFDSEELDEGDILINGHDADANNFSLILPYEGQLNDRFKLRNPGRIWVKGDFVGLVDNEGVHSFLPIGNRELKLFFDNKPICPKQIKIRK
jgi:hypothetical protein